MLFLLRSGAILERKIKQMFPIIIIAIFGVLTRGKRPLLSKLAKQGKREKNKILRKVLPRKNARVFLAKRS